MRRKFLITIIHWCWVTVVCVTFELKTVLFMEVCFRFVAWAWCILDRLVLAEDGLSEMAARRSNAVVLQRTIW